MLREFGQITMILTYVSGLNNIKTAERITRSFNNTLSHSPDQLVYVGRHADSHDTPDTISVC